MDNDTTKLLLSIEDKHIKIETGARGTDGAIRFQGRLDYRPKACPHCGILNEGQIINYGWRNTNVRLARTLENNVLLQLKRRNFQCKACQTTFLAQTSLVPKNCTISNPVRKA
ncbi:transposase family protein [Pediococcus siamensis]|uniref:transposase family protein n=1 Tax=Pediococcus siamensis TaxID=381829 RepID=UPI00399F076E